uniref:Uncharacterized protein n=1 Tax=Ditylenchus dipsaci TaxID=166011 RepID=A0A915DTG3_9BILA
MAFIGTLSVNFPADMAYSGAVDDDFNREAAFMKQAKTAVSMALPRLQKLKVPIFRPMTTSLKWLRVTRTCIRSDAAYLIYRRLARSKKRGSESEPRRSLLVKCRRRTR